MGPMWPFSLMFESRVERHSFCGIETLNDYIFHKLTGCQWTLGSGCHKTFSILGARFSKISIHLTVSSQINM